MATVSNSEGIEALRRLKSSEPPLYLSSSSELSEAARLASQFIFSSLSPHTPKSPFDNLLVKGFDAEQIWQQIDLQSQPLISNFRRELKKLEKTPENISKLFGEVVAKDRNVENEKEESLAMETDDEEGSDSMEDEDMDDLDDEVDEEGSVEEDEEDEEVEEEEGEKGDGGIEDRFLKIKELEEYLQEDEAREYGTKTKKNDSKKGHVEDDEEDEEEDDDEEDDDDQFGLMQDLEDDEEEEDNARYQDFFVAQKKTQKPNSRLTSQLDGSDDDQPEKGSTLGSKKGVLSTHEKEQEKLRLKVEQMEKSNLDPKNWNMMGEISAPKRPKNSALEVDLDFEHNVRPAPVITEEVTASIEDLIRKRIVEGHFDDVQKSLIMPNRAPKELKGMDENKSSKGLAEVYEDEYVQTTGLVSKASSVTDELKKEANTLFKKLCLRLDALSHFHFTPKPVIEDMSIQTNVPALAIEEIAPLAVSDAAMLAPEEVFSGKGGNIKEESELTQAERKRRRANKKRKFKAETILKMEMKKARESVKPKPKGEDSTTEA
ncbi:U3 small nucleolar ribonucleoprotein protein MPP10 [Impatiens glandulifera]|uniref:U3 small nucleolar ribonucleoprotein protein MPP10 n=1 Tax=Impatiens glandulifera TaxID=253017 RepID=UPI001FB0F335|nr:U3 small nucleolar ribonucleoprotein protein MPP10 [Impatiens glandulifera]